MATITLRQIKGTPLTNNEVDDNFSVINIELGLKATQVALTSAVNAVNASISGQQVLLQNIINTKLDNLPGSVLTSNLQNLAVTPAKLSTGGPSWNNVGDFSISGNYSGNNFTGAIINASIGNYTNLNSTGISALNTITGSSLNRAIIGNITPAAGSFTSLTSSGGISGNLTGNVNGFGNLSVGSTVVSNLNAFSNDSRIANAAWVKSLGLYSAGISVYSSSTNIPASDIGKIIKYAGSIPTNILTLPSSSTVPLNSIIWITHEGILPVTVAVNNPASEFITGNRNNFLPSRSMISMNHGENVALQIFNGVWTIISTNINYGQTYTGVNTITETGRIMTTDDYGKFFYYASGLPGSCTLPPINAFDAGKTITIYNLGFGLASTLTVNRSGTNPIYAQGNFGPSSIAISTGDSVTFVTDGAQWFQSGTGSSFGPGQTWQNMLAVRNYNTTYTNTTGKTIVVFTRTSGVANRFLQGIIDGIEVYISPQQPQTSSTITCYVIVPPGKTYTINQSAPTTKQVWSELR